MVGIEIPLVPLNAVLFPGMALRLRVTDERHHALVRHCLGGDRTFGIVLVRCEDKSGAVDLHRVGTTAQIVDVTREKPGCITVTVRGQRRFRLLDYRLQGAYPTARVAWLPDSGGECGTEAGEVIELLSRCLAAMCPRAAPPPLSGDAGLPEDPDELSYAVAALLPLRPTEKQRLLEIPTAEERLREEVALLKERIHGSRGEASHRWVVRPVGKPEIEWLRQWTN